MSTRQPPEETPAKKLGEELREMYKGERFDRKTMSTIDRGGRSLGKKIAVGLVIVFGLIASVSWAGFFLFDRIDRHFSGEKIDLAIDGPFAPKGGDVVTYTITWKNNEAISLGTANLGLRLPKEFTVESTNPAVDDATWTIGAVAPGGMGHVTVTGIFLAAAGKESDIQAILTYRPANFNAEFQKVTTRTVAITDSVLTIAVSGPVKTLPGDPAAFQIAYENASPSQTFNNARIVAAYPKGFIPDAAEPATADAGFTTWPIPALAPGEKGSVTVTGTFASDSIGTAEVGASIGIADDDDGVLLQNKAAFVTEVLQGNLAAALILNGKTDSQNANFGDALRYSLSFKNTGESALGDVELSAIFEMQPDGADLLSWDELTDTQAGIRKDGRITWTKKQVAPLGAIAAGDEGTIEFSLPVIDGPLAGVKSNDYRIVCWLEAKIGTVDGTAVGRVTKSQPITIKINSDAALSSEARYFSVDNEPLGSGPLPPKVGVATTYRVIWKLTNTFHELTDLKLSTKLPDGVIWNGKSSVDAGNLTFDPGGQKMLWTLNWLPTTIDALTVSYDLMLTPDASQIGKIVPLTGAVLFEATDKVTGAPLLLSSPPLTSAIDNDEFAVGQGRVQAAQ